MIRRFTAICAVVAGVSATVLTGAGIPGTTGVAGALGCSDTPGEHVAVVIDFGDAPNAPQGIFADCVPTGATVRSGLQALRAATDGRLGQDASTKICQIMGVPATFDPTNCSAPRDGEVSYWAYFRGDGRSWTYSAVGAAGVRATPTIVEGWRYVTVPLSQQTSAAPPPRNFIDGASYRWQTTCAAAPAQTVPPPGSTSAPTPAPAGPTGGGAPATTVARVPGPVQGGGDDGVASPPAGRDARDVPPASAPTRDRSTTAPPSASTSTPPGSAASTTPSTLPGAGGLRSAEEAERIDGAAVVAATHAAEKSSGRPLGALLVGGGGVAVVLVGSSILTARSRRARRGPFGDDGDPGASA